MRFPLPEALLAARLKAAGLLPFAGVFPVGGFMLLLAAVAGTLLGVLAGNKGREDLADLACRGRAL